MWEIYEMRDRILEDEKQGMSDITLYSGD